MRKSPEERPEKKAGNIQARGEGEASRPGSGDQEIAAFLEKVKATPVSPRSGGALKDRARGRLIFGMDATASREAMWDQACHLQGEMFTATDGLGGLDIQLIFYRGFGECKASKWATDSTQLARLMSSVRCRAGRTQISRILTHARAESEQQRIGAQVFVGDCFEEDLDHAAAIAGELGLLGTPVFMFQEGRDPIAARAFKEIARLSGGAYCPFDATSARQLKELLSAVAVYAAGGQRAMLDYAQKAGEAVLQLSHQLRC